MDVLGRFEDEMTVDDDRPSIAFHREGNLFLVSEPDRPAARRAMDLQLDLGGRVEWWTPEQIEREYPLYRADGLAGGTFGPGDGHLDAYAVLMAYKAKARSLGAVFLKDEVTEIIHSGGRVSGVRLATGGAITAGCVVNCTGAWAAELAKSAGVDLPVLPVKRQIYTLDTAVKPDGSLPLTILPSGLYFRTEVGGFILLGKSMPEDPVGFDFSWDRDRFQEILWPELAELVPAFDTLKLVRGWAGLYAENTLDGNAILGEWPEMKGFFLANGFSGHGLQQAPAVGRYMAELILGIPPRLDLSVFKPDRILENTPLSENGLV
jgi:glycine/D-amino acid oxidase-like deaminating enzyme